MRILGAGLLLIMGVGLFSCESQDDRDQDRERQCNNMAGKYVILGDTWKCEGKR